jgi:hypothetical protein
MALRGRRWALTAILAIAPAVVAGTRAAIRPSERARMHEAKARDYAAIGADAVDFAEIDIFSPVDVASLRERHSRLADRLTRLRSSGTETRRGRDAR